MMPIFRLTLAIVGLTLAAASAAYAEDPKFTIHAHGWTVIGTPTIVFGEHYYTLECAAKMNPESGRLPLKGCKVTSDYNTSWTVPRAIRINDETMVPVLIVPVIDTEDKPYVVNCGAKARAVGDLRFPEILCKFD